MASTAMAWRTEPGFLSRTAVRPTGPRVVDGGARDAPAPEDVVADPETAAALLDVMAELRHDRLTAAAAALRARGVDATVCAFLEDDLREATDSLADIEAFFQETLESLETAAAPVLGERAADVTVLQRLDHLHLTLSNLRRRLVQVAAGVRGAQRPL